ncbi:MAG: GEVED domain-containing protein, partial [Chitinophagales bacterium]|nr:GEVED domain-containing protein [Chitinophagales bacterium]
MRNLSIFVFLMMFSVLSNGQNKIIPEKVKQLQRSGQEFVDFDLFAKNNDPQNSAKYQSAATDVTVLNIDSQVLDRINNESPSFIKIVLPYQEDLIEVLLYQEEVLTTTFKARDSKGQIIPYRPGKYYRGIIGDDYNSLAGISFFNNNIIGVVSSSRYGNIVIGKSEDKSNYVCYSDRNLLGSNPFNCAVEDIKLDVDDQIQEETRQLGVRATTNCVRIYYEISNEIFLQLNSDVQDVLDWITGVHNNIDILYDNDDIRISMSSVKVWETPDPYVFSHTDNLYYFKYTVKDFDGDLGHLVKYPATTSVAFLNSLCSSYRYAYSAVNITYGQVPVYSWTIMAMTHEMGHSMGSPHTHACAWNGDDTAIDGCGPTAGYSEGCTAPLPVSGTIMSYCHLVGGVGIDLNNGFGPQPATLIQNTVDSKPCLSTDCSTLPTDCFYDIIYNVAPITKVQFADINNLNDIPSTDVSLQDFTGITGHLTAGTNYPITLQGASPFTDAYDFYFTVWIDWDQDGFWNNMDEMYQVGFTNPSYSSGPKQVSNEIQVPASAVPGTTTMRVIMNYDEYPEDACLYYFYGQAEDYTIEVLPAGIPSTSTCFSEDFSDIINGNSTSTNGSNTGWTGNANFPTVVKAYQAGGAVRLGNSANPRGGSIESIPLIGVSGDIIVKVNVKGWTNIEAGIKVSIDGQTQSLIYAATIADPFEWVWAYFTNVTDGSVLKIETDKPTNQNQRCFIDAVEIVCGVCPDLSVAPDNVTITNSSCVSGCTVSGGSIVAPTTVCPDGSTMEYSVDNGATWSIVLPIYNQTGPPQTIITRCTCDEDPDIFSPSSTAVTTVPATCATPTVPVITITDNVCPSTDGTIAASGCDSGTTLEWSVDGTNWSTVDPDYSMTAFTVFARCVDNTTGCISNEANATTAPEVCGGGSVSCFHEDFSDILNGNNTTTGGSGTIWNGNANFPTVLRAYQAGGAVRIGTSSNNGSIESRDLLNDVTGDITVNIMVKGWTTVEGGLIVSIDGSSQTLTYTAVMSGSFEQVTANFIGVSPNSKLKIETTAKRAFIDDVEVFCSVNTCPDLSAAPANVTVVNSTCTDCSVSGGLITAPSNACPSGSTLEFSEDNGLTWTTIVPAYNQTGPAQTIITRCSCDDDPSIVSPSSMAVTTVPGTCPSNCDYTISISDPCVCNNDATKLGNDGTFNEQITVIGAPGQFISGACSGCVPSSLTFVEGPAGTYVSNTFKHIDNLGYIAVILENGVLVGTIGNKCAYPDVAIDPIGPFTNCININDDYPLTATITGDNGSGTYAWSGTGVTGSNFNPSGVPAGKYAIDLIYTGIDNGHISPDGGSTAAYPGCIQPAQDSITVNNGIVPPVIDDIEVCEGESTLILAPALGLTTAPITFTWDFEVNINGVGVSSNTTVAENAPVQTVGTGISSSFQGMGSGCSAAISLTGFDIANATLADAVADAEYIEFCVGNPQIGVNYLGVTSINWIHRRSGSGPISWAIVPASDLTNPLLTGMITGTNCDSDGGAITPDPLETCYRLYYWGATNATGTLRISDMILSADYEVPSGTYNFYTVDPLLNPGAIPVATGLSYDPGTTVSTSPQTIYVTVYDGTIDCESLPDSVKITVLPNPTLDIVQPDFVCAPDSIDVTIVDLGASPTGGVVTYHNTYQDAEDAINPITSGLDAVKVAGSIFVRYEVSTGCFAIGEIIVDIRDLPAAPIVPDSIIHCYGESTLITLSGDAGTVVTTWDFEGGISGQGISSDPTKAGNGPVQIAGIGLQSVIAQPAGSGCSAAISASGFDIGNASLADAIASNDYFEFCIGSPVGGYTFNGVNAINWGHRRSNTGPLSWALVTANNPGTVILTGTIAGTSCTTAGGAIPLNTESCYRVYYWGATNITGTLRIDNFEITADYDIPLVYNWYNVDPDADPTAIPVATGTSYDPMTTPATSPQSIWVNVDNGCKSPAAKIVVVVIDTVILNNIPNQALCHGASTAPVNFTGSPTGVQFTWTNSDPSIGLGASGNGNIPSFVAINNTGATKVATITVTPQFTYSDKICIGVAKTFTITVYPLPNPTISYIDNSGLVDNDGVICLGDEATIVATGGGTYLWNTGATTSSITVSPTATTTYTVTVTSVNGCSGTISGVIVVQPVPVVSISVTENSGVVPNDGIIYTGSSATLTASGGGTYLWSTGATSATIIVTPPVTTTYTVTVTNANNCSTTAERVITVVDPPCHLVCSQDQTVTLADGTCEYQLPNLVTTAGDCRYFTVEQISGPTPGEFLPKGTYEIQYRIVSNLGEIIKACSFTVTVQGRLNTTKTLTCNNFLYISADANCEVALNADMFLEGSNYGCYSDYTIMIWPFGYEQNKYAIEQNKSIYIPLGEHMYEVIDPVSGNRCWGSFKIEDKLAPVVACNCEDVDIIAPISEFVGVLEDTDPLFNRCGAAYIPQYYDVFEFQVSATGSYTFSAVDQYNDTYAYIYQDSFDPANPCNNVVAQGDDGSGAL